MMEWIRLAGGMLIIGTLLALIILSPRNAEAADIRLSLATEAYHGRGYSGTTVRIGENGGGGIRLGRLQAPETFKQDATLIEADYELCGSAWCFGAGLAWITHATVLNGTQGNFGLHIRYQINANWSLVLDHYSHGRALGIEKDKSNRGWNLIGVAYSF